MKRACVVLGLAVFVGCNATYTVDIREPYCPVSDSARAHADSVPASCVLPDSVRR